MNLVERDWQMKRFGWESGRPSRLEVGIYVERAIRKGTSDVLFAHLSKCSLTEAAEGLYGHIIYHQIMSHRDSNCNK